MTILKSHKPLAFWALTPNGGRHALRLLEALGDGHVFVSDKAGLTSNKHCDVFQGLAEEITQQFHRFSGHVFFMATGIVVRMIAPLIVHKMTDPSVVVVDDQAIFSISLLSGHMGGANRLAQRVADILGAQAVITTATDVNQAPAIDMMAKDKGLIIENPEAIKIVNMAFLLGNDVGLHDPYGYFGESGIFGDYQTSAVRVCVDDRKVDAPPGTLLLRPKTLVAGIGCNRGTAMGEIQDLLLNTLDEAGLSPLSLRTIASVDIKHDEQGILDLGDAWHINIEFFTRDQLGTVETIETPSAMVKKHIGVTSVCEAAAILAANTGPLIVPKRKTPNVTVALARISFTS